ncbi:MAG: MATE family efflux transporter [Oscillospiraceae bacterium]|jgi:putative MATE family efflux protein|nr:MATE family efflux transporter [Oscillospiraceae bacterium]
MQKENQKHGYQIDMVNGPLAGKLLLFALPLMLSGLLQLLFNAADIVVVGRYAGKEALAAVGSTSSLINLLVNLFIGFSVGTNVVVARDLGAGREEDVNRSVHTAIALALISGVCLTALGLTLARQLLVWTESAPDVIGLATVYLRIYFAGMPFNMLYNFGAAILRAQGDTRRPLYFLSIAGVANVVLNLFFVIVLHMSVAGVALATIISQGISAVLVLTCLMRDQGALHLDPKALRLDRRVIRRICQVGLPAGFQGIVFSLSNVVIQSSINSFGSTAIIAGSAASANIEGFVYTGMNAIYQTNLTFTSQNYGAGQCRRVDRCLILCQTYVVVIGLILGNLAAIFGAPLASIYAPGEADVIAQAVTRLKIISGTYCLCGVMDVMVGSLRGLGYSMVPMVVSMVGACGVRLIWVATIFQTYHTPTMLYISYPVSWTITAAVHIAFFFFIRKHAYAKSSGMQNLSGAPKQEKNASEAA